MRTTFVTCAAALMSIALSFQARSQEIPIWPGKPPGSEHWAHREIDFPITRAISTGPGRTHWTMVRNVATPTLTVFLPDPAKATGTGVVICPGGGFRILSWESEGTDVAQWLAARGVAAFVLKYRLLPMPADQKEFERELHIWSAKSQATVERTKAVRDDQDIKIVPLAIADGLQAMRVVRKGAAKWGLLSDRIGIMGFSAGAIVTMGVVLDHDADSRPDFAAPIYGGEVDGRTIPTDAPPLFLLVAQDDLFERRITLKLYSDWHGSGHSAELHVFAKGGHGFGMTKQGLPVDHWVDLFGDWLEWQTSTHPRDVPHATATVSTRP